eukprot:a347217_13.p2 GENE.a347217_13~~a347217_13.p2  ORF type:complete len:254 (-),score=54.25 a347217_13:30-764(-)
MSRLGPPISQNLEDSFSNLGTTVGASGADAIDKSPASRRERAASTPHDVERQETMLSIVFVAQSVALVVLLILSVTTKSTDMGTVDSPWYYAIALAACVVGVAVVKVPAASAVRVPVLAVVLAVTFISGVIASGFFVVYWTWTATTRNRCRAGLKTTDCDHDIDVLQHHCWRLFAHVLVLMASLHLLVGRIVMVQPPNDDAPHASGPAAPAPSAMPTVAQPQPPSLSGSGPITAQNLGSSGSAL